MIEVYHMGRDWDGDTRWKAGYDDPARADQTALELFLAGRYQEVARVSGDSLEAAYRLTQNIDTSWSMQPDPSVTVLAPVMRLSDGRRMGLKSSEVGDVFIHGSDIYRCARVGWSLIGQRQGHVATKETDHD